MAWANGEGEGDAVPAEDQARVVAPTAAELAEGLSVDRVWEALEQALSQPSKRTCITCSCSSVAPDGVVGLEGRGKDVVGDPQEGLEEGVPGLRGEAHGGLLDEGLLRLE